MHFTRHAILLTLVALFAGCATPRAVDDKSLAQDEGVVVLSVSSDQRGRLTYEDASLSGLESAALFVGEKMRVDVGSVQTPQLMVFTAKAGQYRVATFGVGNGHVNFKGRTVTVKAGVANYIGRARIGRVDSRTYALSESDQVAEDRPKFEARYPGYAGRLPFENGFARPAAALAK